MPKCSLRTYPLRVRYGLVWVFFGDAERAHDVPMPEIPELEGNDRWACVPVDFTWKAHHSMIIDNVSDFTHEYLHRKYAPFSQAKLTRLETVGDTVQLAYDTKVGGKIHFQFGDRGAVTFGGFQCASSGSGGIVCCAARGVGIAVTSASAIDTMLRRYRSMC